MTAADPWGKLDRKAPDRATAPRLSLVAHCIDVAAVMQALLALPTVVARLCALAGRPLTPLDRTRLVALAFLHDIGKAGSGFQSRGMDPALADAWRRRTRASRDQTGHVLVTAPLFGTEPAFEAARTALGVDAVFAWGGDSRSGQSQIADLWLAAISHHGEPVTQTTMDRHDLQSGASWRMPVGGYSPLDGLAQLGTAARTLFAAAFDREPMARVAPALVHAYAGLVSLADWIGSNSDDDFFPYRLGELQTTGRWRVACKRAGEVLRRMHVDVEPAREDLRRRDPRFEQVFGFEAHDTQRQAAAWSPADSGRVAVLEAETGSGKTEAALWRFKTLLEAGEVDSLCFLLPTRVAATGIYGRVQRFIDRLFPDPALRPPVVLAVPGYLRANGDEGRRALAGFEVLWPDRQGGKDRALYWAAENSKRYFAASAAAATIDQFLLSALQVRHAHLRGSLALRSLVVVDEVHASDVYMTTLLLAALERHAAAGGHALLMSATLTGELRERLLQAGAPKSPGPRRADPALASPTAPYPAFSTRAGVRRCDGAGRDKQVHIECRPAMRDADQVAAIAAADAAHGARVLVLRNTVRQAVATQQALERRLGADHPALFRLGRVAALHHGRYAFEDRQLLDASVEAMFGTAAIGSREPRVLVGTQTLEISVDCDSDVMLTDLAPIDVLLQRLGRLHRHADRDPHRPDAARRPRLVVLVPPERDLAPLIGARSRGMGIGPRSAYENLLSIEATWRLLEARSGEWRIPHDNRELVEAGAGTAALQALAETLGGEWPAHAAAMAGQRSARAAAALPVRLQWDQAWSRAGWSELGEEVRTRLGLDGVDIELPQPWRTPLGGTIRRLTVPAWMLRGSGPFELTGCDDLGDRLRLSVGDVDLVYGRLGLAHADA